MLTWFVNERNQACWSVYSSFSTAIKKNINTNGCAEERGEDRSSKLTELRYQCEFCFGNITQQLRLPFGIELIGKQCLEICRRRNIIFLWYPGDLINSLLLRLRTPSR